ncbi:hypothetical protein [Aurantiacibacter hainanensis]|uniref:hypothetical protein n=1 Tax=Aurantiacibacter hainanensis TaxID=3076114 RepID=UPI0030C7573C
MLTFEAASQRIAADLEQAEILANELQRAIARLQLSMMNLRLDTDIAPYEGQASVIRVQEAQSKAVALQSDLLKAHKGLRSDFTRITMVPDDRDRCPAEPFTTGARDAA